MTESYNCPNCGAPIGYSPHCQYCGTLLNWIPAVAVTFKAEREKIKTLACRCRVSYSKFYYFGEAGQRATEKMLAEQMAEKLTEVWNLEIKDVPGAKCKEYCATVRVCVKQEVDDGKD